jgi:PAS domain S-box-containing protein
MSTQRKNTKAKIRLSFVAAVLCIGFFVLVTYRNMLLTESESRHINSSVEKLLKLERLLIDLQDVETGQRGFIITGEEKFLDQFYVGMSNIKTDTLIIKSLIQQDTSNRSSHEQLLQLINQKIAFSKYVVEMRRLLGYNAAAGYIQNEEGLKLMQNIRRQVDQLEQQDRQLFEKANRNRDRLSQKRAWQLFSLALIFYIILFINYWVISNDYKIQQRNERVLKYNASLISIISDAVITTDKNFRITNWNRYAEQIYGYSEKDVLGKTILEVLKVNYENYDPQEVNRLYSETDNWRGEVIHYTKDNTALNVDVAVSAIRDTEGTYVGSVSVIRNITERIRTQERLKQLTTHLEEEVKIKVRELNSVFERITDAFIALDNNWRYTYVNQQAAEMHHRKPEDLIGKNIWEVFPDVVGEPFYDALQQASRDRKSRRLELYFSKTDSWFEDLIYPSADGISVYYHDITKRKKAEQQLLSSERELKVSNERFMLVSKATNDAVWDWDMVNDVIWGNERFRQIFSLPADVPITFREYVDRLHAEDKDTILLNLKKALDQKTTYLTEEFRFRSADQQLLYFIDRAYVLYNEEGRAYRMLGAMQDVTDQKKAQYQILMEKELSDSIINSLPGIFYLLNRDGEYYRWNRNFELVTGYNAEEIERLRVPDLFNDAERPLIAEKMAHVFESGETNVEAHIITKHGEAIPYYFTGMPINYEGEICLMGVGIDISERMKSQQELKQSEEKYRLLFNQNPLPMLMLRMPDRQFIDVNDAAIDFYGYSKEEFRNMNIFDLRPDEPEHPLEEVHPFRTGIHNEGIWQQRKKEGTLVTVNLITHDIVYEGRNVKLVLANDVTEKIRAEEELKRSHEDLRQLATHLQDIREDERTHIAREIHDELGQQLTGLKMDISWLSKKVPNPPEEISRKLTEALLLIDDTVKTVRRIATQLRPSILDDLGLISAMEWQSEEFEKRFQIICSFHSSLGVIDLDKEIATGMFRIYQECLTNVLRHSRATAVKALLSAGNGALRLQVTDNGVGFNSAEIETKKTLGLLGMKERTLMMGGTYEIVSKPGQGTTVIITVPAENI